jgi:hypothetical protein
LRNPRDWSSTAYFVIGAALGALLAYGVLSALDLPSWAQILVAFLVPTSIAFLAVAVREDIFFWLMP